MKKLITASLVLSTLLMPVATTEAATTVKTSPNYQNKDLAIPKLDSKTLKLMKDRKFSYKGVEFRDKFKEVHSTFGKDTYPNVYRDVYGVVVEKGYGRNSEVVFAGRHYNRNIVTAGAWVDRMAFKYIWKQPVLTSSMKKVLGKATSSSTTSDGLIVNEYGLHVKLILQKNEETGKLEIVQLEYHDVQLSV